MPDLQFQITGVEPARHGLTPLLHFKLHVTATPPDETIQALILQSQIQIRATQRTYQPREKRNLFEIFGPPESWGQTLGSRLWTYANTTTGSFTGCIDATLSVPCTFDLNVLATKYFQALESGNIPLLFLFSGSMFYTLPDGRLQVQRISWNKEAAFAMPLTEWQELMRAHYPESGWVPLRHDTLDRLGAYRRASCLTSWEETIDRLLRLHPGLEAAQ